MARPISFGKIESYLTAGESDRARTPASETPFRILVLGDYSGREILKQFDSGKALARRSPLPIDRDNLQEIMGRLEVKLHLSLSASGGHPLVLRFAEIDDFHPDRIFSCVEIFHNLMLTRQNLLNASTSPAATEQVKQWIQRLDEASEPTAKQPEPETSVTVANQLSADFLLEGMRGRQRTQEVADEWEAMLREAVKPYLLPREDPKQAELVAAVDAIIGSLMRRVLHHPDFQALEAAWRGLNFLVRELETGTKLQLFLLDLSKEELSADLQSSEDLQSTQAYRVLVEETLETPGAEPWAVIVGNYTFDTGLQDVEVLGRLTKLAGRAGAPFIAAAHSKVLGCQSLAETPDPRDWDELSDSARGAWEALRQLPESVYLGLTLPRFLLRLPYGRKSDPVEKFTFEELDLESPHESYLWGNPAFVSVYLLAQAFSESGWNSTPGEVQDVGGLPLHVTDSGGASTTKPCAEVLLTERAAEAILNQGVMPLLSMKGRDSVRLARFQSIAQPLAALAGRWS
jgi:type VI secretion system protein ImpC